jgi:hypothetical protein
VAALGDAHAFLLRRSARPLAIAFAAIALSASCTPSGLPGRDAGADASPPAPSPALPGAPAAPAAASPHASGSRSPSAPDPGATVHLGPGLEVLRLRFTTGVKRKDPVDRLRAAPAGSRVYAHVAMRNRSPGARSIALAFDVEGSERSRVRLDVERSWSFRTWAYVTLRPTDRGELRVRVEDETGEELARASLPIRPAAQVR